LVSNEKSMTCTTCHYKYYHNCSGATAGIITKGNQLLVIKRKYDPGKDMYGVPGGFVDYDETLEQGFVREIKEELNVTLTSYQYYASYPNRYVYKDVLYHTIDAYFTAEIDDSVTITPGDDAAAYEWIDLTAVDINVFAFESAKQIVKQYLAKRLNAANEDGIIS
jgi:ADP-ribose pyrophosphatase YjhB (NUDIX family)